MPTPRKRAGKAKRNVQVSRQILHVEKEKAKSAERLAKAEAKMNEMRQKLKIAEQISRKAAPVPVTASLPLAISSRTIAPTESIVDMATALFKQTAALSQLVAESEKQTLARQREIAVFNQQTALVLEARVKDNKRKESLLDAENGFFVAEYDLKAANLLKKRNLMSFDEDPSF